MKTFDCQHCDEYGFCTKYSNDAVVWKCKEDADCGGLFVVMANMFPLCVRLAVRLLRGIMHRHRTTAPTAVQRWMVMGMGCSEMPNINKPLACPICEKEPMHTKWFGQYKPEIHQLACLRCGKIVRGYSKQKAVERWNKSVLEYAFRSYGERKDNVRRIL